MSPPSTAVPELVAWMVAAYLVAAIPVGVVVAKARGIDLRAVGSGNIGATNAVRALGARWGIAVFALDVGKAFAPVAAARMWMGNGADPVGLALVGLAAVLGHVFPVYLRFHGGKGVACALGVFAALDPWAALAALVLYGQTLWLTRVSAVGSLTAVTGMTLLVLLADKPPSLRVLAVVMATLIWMRHTSNVRALTAEAKARKQTDRSGTG